MKKITLILAMALCFNLSFTKANEVKIDSIKTELVSDSLKQVLISEATTLLKDSAFRAELTENIKTEISEKPTESSSLLEWIYYVVGIIMLIVGSFVSKMPTTKSNWYLQIFQVFFRWLINEILAPKNKSVDGGTHKL